MKRGLLIGVVFILTAVMTMSGLAQSEPPEIKAAPGFKVEDVYSFPKEQGSWISLALDSKGRLFASDQFGLLYRITLANGAAAPHVEPIRVLVKDDDGNPTGQPLGDAQGLAWAGDSLYVVVNGTAGVGSGLYRLTDKSGKDMLDSAEFLT